MTHDAVFEFKEPIQSPCPFCFGHFIVDAAEGAEPCVMHSMPPCQTYLDHDIDVYLRRVRETWHKEPTPS